MTEKDILYKCIDKAVKNGYIISTSLMIALNEGKFYNNTIHFKIEENYSYHINEIIFDHEFAKAFWGEEEVDDCGRNLDIAWEELWKNEGQHMDKDDFENDFGFDIETKIAWQYHLKQMVTMKEPLKYLEKFL